ncbi:MAG TPA: vitamin K epoxide reductase family protein [Pyrinomonadaceae bacterium]|nr:vitamin K epoxide reductase family protein [Pyrinomonadaceae bacterium]
MSDFETTNDQTNGGVAKLPLLAALIALIGIGDAVYLTVNHYTKEQVPCSLITGCEQVLTSAYAEMFGIPLALFGAVAYFLAFSLAVLAAFGNRLMWFLFGLLTAFMLFYTIYLIYLQAYVIQAFCQFCLLSAATTLTLFIIALISKFWQARQTSFK